MSRLHKQMLGLALLGLSSLFMLILYTQPHPTHVESNSYEIQGLSGYVNSSISHYTHPYISESPVHPGELNTFISQQHNDPHEKPLDSTGYDYKTIGNTATHTSSSKTGKTANHEDSMRSSEFTPTVVITPAKNITTRTEERQVILTSPAFESTTRTATNQTYASTTSIHTDKNPSPTVALIAEQYYKTWEYYTLPNGTNITLPPIPADDEDLSVFRPVVTPAEIRLLYHLLQVLVSTCQQHRLTCMLSDGSLIGSYRHQAMIPWDDDVDVIYLVKEKDQLSSALNNISNYGASNATKCCMKFYSTLYSQRHSATAFPWPFIDLIGYSDVNSTHIRGPALTGNSRHIPKRYFFPTRTRPFGPLQVPAPGKGLKVLDFNYTPVWRTHCITHHYTHKYAGTVQRRVNQDYKQKNVPCGRLKKYYPLLHRDKSTETAKEILTLNDHIL